ncbi:MAG TPA: TrkA family potassium uptake protein [Candidatus Polarisedimenticolaceae bacterium]|nr:TrkA family potassium uptake protein [Candidatus Polarisedimenticolaceae bacterium]
MARQFAVIGLGAFGRQVAIQLERLGHEVLAIDLDERLVNAVAEEIEASVRADATDESALREMHVDGVSCAVVAIGAEAIEASILATTLLRQIGVPQIVARAVNPLHARALRAVGAHAVVRPEEEMGERLARRLAQPNVLERIELGRDAELAEVPVPGEFVGKSLIDLEVRRRHAVTVVAIRRGDRILATLEGSERMEAGDVLVVIGAPAAIEKLASRA